MKHVPLRTMCFAPSSGSPLRRLFVDLNPLRRTWRCAEPDGTGLVLPAPAPASGGRRSDRATAPSPWPRPDPVYECAVSDLLESVPNFSVGRDQAVLDALSEAFGAAGVRVLDVHADSDHNRSVFTVVADPDTLVEGLASAIAVAHRGST